MYSDTVRVRKGHWPEPRHERAQPKVPMVADVKNIKHGPSIPKSSLNADDAKHGLGAWVWRGLAVRQCHAMPGSMDPDSGLEL